MTDTSSRFLLTQCRPEGEAKPVVIERETKNVRNPFALQFIKAIEAQAKQFIRQKIQEELTALETEWFEGLDLTQIEKETGFSVHDLVVIFAQVPEEQHENLRRSLLEYVAAREEFFNDPEDPQAFANYRNYLLTLLYPLDAEGAITQMDAFIDQHGEGRTAWAKTREIIGPREKGKQVYYQLYADLFTVDEAGETHGFEELIELLDYIEDLGCTHIWVLPPFDSPGHDNGFDPAKRREIMENLGGNEMFIKFVRAAAERGITIKVDMVLHHLSYQSAEFQAAIDPAHPEHEKYRGWFYFEQGVADGSEPERYPAYVIFGDMHMPTAGKEIFPEAAGVAKTSNWVKVILADGKEAYVYTRFKPQMPDLNFKNPEVIINELDVMRYWLDLLERGMVLRYDALKHVWKMDRQDISAEYLEQHPALVELIEDYQGDNLVQNRLITYLLRAYALHRYGDHVDMIAEVWDRPEAVLKYTGVRDGAREGGGYFDFHTMHALLQTIHTGDNSRLHQAIAVSRAHPPGCLALCLLRHHDGMAGSDTGDNDLGMDALAEALNLSAETAAALQAVYPDFDSKQGLWFDGGWATRLRDFLVAQEGTEDPQVIVELIKRAFMQLFYLAQTPLFYMGDEFGERNDEAHLLRSSIGPDGEALGLDMRNVHRSIGRPMDKVLEVLQDKTTVEHQLHQMMKRLIALRKENGALAQGRIESLSAFTANGQTELVEDSQVFAAYKEHGDTANGLYEYVVMLTNLVSEAKTVQLAVNANMQIERSVNFVDLVTGEIVKAEIIENGDGKIYLRFELAARESRWLMAN